MSEEKKMSRKKIIAIVIVVLVLLVAGGWFIAYKKGVFKASNYQYLRYSKYITVGKYKGLTYTKPSPTVTEKEVQAEIKTRVAAKATTTEEKTGTVKNGDTLNVSYEGKVNGKTFDGGSAKNVSIEISSDSNMIPGFVEGLVGKKIGSKVVLNLTFPKDYDVSNLAGKAVVFTVTINSRTKTVTPKYNLAFVKKYTKYKTLKAYEASVKEDLKQDKIDEEMDTVRSNLWSEIVSKSKVKTYPKKQLDYEVKFIKDSYEKMASNYGMTLTKYLKQMGMTKSEYNSSTKKYGKLITKQKLILYSIAKEEGIKLSDKEYKEKLNNMLKKAGYTEDTFKQQYSQTIEEYGEENDFRTSMLLDKVMEKVTKYAKAETKTSSSK